MMRTPSLGGSVRLSSGSDRRSWSMGPPCVGSCTVRPGQAGCRSDLEQLGFLLLEGLVDLRFLRVRELVEVLLGPSHLVLGDPSVLGQRLQLVTGAAPQVADG